MSVESETKSVVSVAEMARMCGLSRSRFYQLMGTAFPWPLYYIETQRPFYMEEQQAVCLEVRRRNCGIDGKPVMFYAKRSPVISSAKTRGVKRPASKTNEYADLIAGLKALGLADVTTAQVESAVKAKFPRWDKGMDQGEVLRVVFVHLKRQSSGDNVGR